MRKVLQDISSTIFIVLQFISSRGLVAGRMAAHKGNKYRRIDPKERKLSVTFRAHPRDLRKWEKKAGSGRGKFSKWVNKKLNAK